MKSIGAMLEQCDGLRDTRDRRRFNDITGYRFGMLVAVRMVGFNKNNKAMWECLCDCGKTTIAIGSGMKSGNTQSCGCRKAEAKTEANTKHGHTKQGKPTKTFMIWAAMIKRCAVATNKNFHNYGGRGISVCERWNYFENFLADMGEAPAGLSIERIEVNGNYNPGNCKWATHEEQCNNKRTNIIVRTSTEVMTLAQFARKVGIDYLKVWKMIKSGDRVINGIEVDAYKRQQVETIERIFQKHFSG